MTIHLAQRKLNGWETVCLARVERAMIPPNSLTVLANWLRLPVNRRCPKCWAAFQEFAEQSRFKGHTE